MIEGTAQGRAAAWFIRFHDEEWVLRHYRRGGLPAKFSNDRFLWIGLRRSRPWRELSVLSQLHALGLPVPVPIAGRIQRKTASYTADIMTRRIQGARSLADFMFDAYFRDSQDPSARDGVWRETGRVIRMFHAIGAHHADLNVRNILVDDQRKVWLIDWDRGRLNAGAAIQNRSMARLRRSLSREAELETMARQGWPLLMSAYSGGA
ncbi:3-deoxy-D-manno-octulosonic acid kinase [Spiribacter sp. 221]